MQVTTEEYYYLQAPIQQGVSFYQQSQLETIESGTTLTITPHIGDNNDITLQIAVEVSDSIPQGQGNDLPVVTRRKAENVVRIKDGGTVALAGLSENRTRIQKKRTPGLSNLPLLGDLFKNSNDQNSSREVAVFVTARIVSYNYQQARIPETPASLDRMSPGMSPGMSSGITPGMAPGTPAPSLPQGQDFQSALRQSLSRQSR
jgi:type II secretory pathway component GspD/PulD (secretin)